MRLSSSAACGWRSVDLHTNVRSQRRTPRMKLKLSLSFILALVAADGENISSVPPSAGPRRTASAATLVLAPGRLSWGATRQC